ncbi:lipoprotein [Mesoplasma florum]|uniref:lipoprotein n=1 Tax=Mesoplasma florum TaxID=2151 RepID=UPI00131A4028|nr:lipoprotein [Mesoplasma florum]
MKKLLSILGAVGLTATGASVAVSCSNPTDPGDKVILALGDITIAGTPIREQYKADAENKDGKTNAEVILDAFKAKNKDLTVSEKAIVEGITLKGAKIKDGETVYNVTYKGKEENTNPEVKEVKKSEVEAQLKGLEGTTYETETTFKTALSELNKIAGVDSMVAELKTGDAVVDTNYVVTVTLSEGYSLADETATTKADAVTFTVDLTIKIGTVEVKEVKKSEVEAQLKGLEGTTYETETTFKTALSELNKIAGVDSMVAELKTGDAVVDTNYVVTVTLSEGYSLADETATTKVDAVTFTVDLTIKIGTEVESGNN